MTGEDAATRVKERPGFQIKFELIQDAFQLSKPYMY